MSVQRLKNGKYLARVPRGDHVPGEKRRTVSKCFRTQKAAKDWEREQLGKLKAGEWVAPSRETVAQYLQRWIEQKLPLHPIRSRTARKYAEDLRRYVVPLIGSVQLTQLTRERVKLLATELLATPAKKGGKVPEGEAATLGPRTVKHALMALSAAMTEALDDGLIARHPVQRIKVPKPAPDERVMWSRAHLWQFLDAVRDSEFANLWTVATLTGVRPGEAAAVRWADVDLERGRMRVAHSLTPERKREKGTHWSLSEPKTARSRRVVILPAEALEALERQRVRQGAERLAAGAAYRDHGFVFAKPNGEPYRSDRFSKALGKDCVRAEVPIIKPYTFRHQHTTWMQSADVDLTVNSAQKGHSSVTVTADVYWHGGEEAQVRGMEKLAGYLRQGREGA